MSMINNAFCRPAPAQCALLFMCAALWGGRESTQGGLAFSNYVEFAAGAPTEAVAIADLNGDGRNDVVLSTSSGYGSTNENSVLLFLQNASGRLNAPLRYRAGAPVTSVVLADFNGDGAKDIAVGLNSLGIRVLWNAHGTFNAYADYVSTNSNKLCAGDFNHDGLMDLAGIGVGEAPVEVFTQLKSGGLSPGVQYLAFYAGDNDLKSGDMNGDGWTDIVLMNGRSSGVPHVSVLLQTESGFAPVVPYILDWHLLKENTHGIGIGDLNGDGRNDVVATFGGNRPNSRIAVFTQSSQGVLRAPIYYSTYDIPRGVAVADLDLDGRQDVIVLHDAWMQAGVYLQAASGTLAPEQLFGLPYGDYPNPHCLAVGDINGDGRPDIVLADSGSRMVVLYNASTR